MKCTNCGKEVKKTDKFCQYCGTEVKAEEKKTTKTAVVEKKAETKKTAAKKVEAVKVEEPKVEEKKSGNGLAIASMVLGIIGIVFSLILGPVAFILPLLALIFGLCSKKSGYKTAGIITSIVGFVIEIIIIIIYVLFFSSLFSLIGNYVDNYDYNYNNNYNYDYDYDSYKNKTPYGTWKCEPYPSSSSNPEKTTLKFSYTGTFTYGPSDSLYTNYYSGKFTYEDETEKNNKYTDKYFINIKAPVSEFVMDGVKQDATNKNLNMEMQLIDDYDTAVIMFYNTYNTYKCER